MASNEATACATEMINDCGTSSKLVCKLIDILKECISRKTYATQRLKDNVEQFLTLSQSGYWVRNLGNVIYFIELLSENFTMCLPYRTWIIRLLQIARISPISCVPSDSITYQDDLTEYFSMFGEVLLWAPDKEVLDMVCTALTAIFLKDHPYLACTPRHRCIELLAKSRLPGTLVDLMKISDLSEYAKLLVCVEAILQSSDIGHALLKADILNIMFTNIGAPAIHDGSANTRLFLQPIPVYFKTSLTILWRLGEIISYTPERELISLNVYMSDESWRYCHGMFRKLILLRHKKTLRNSYFATVVNIALYIPRIGRYSWDFAQDWAMLIAASEQGTLGTWGASLIFSNDPAEYEFKKMLLVSVSLCSRYPYISRSLVQRDVYQSIFNILTPEVEVIWTKSQRKHLMVYALGALSYMIKKHMREFLFYLGPNRLIRVIRNSMDGNLPLSVLTPCLRCIYSTLLIDEQVVTRPYRRRGGFDTLLSLTGLYASAHVMNTEVQQVVILCFCILGILQGSTKFRGTTLDISLSFLNRYLNPVHGDTLLHPNVLIVTVDYLWMTVTSHRDAPELFVENGGIFVLLDVLQKAPLLIKTIILGFITDLCHYNIALPLILTWRGENGVTLTEVLLEIFRKESQLIGSGIDEDGVLTDLECPLIGKLQKSLSRRKLKESLCSSPSILDMYGSCRPKICAILTILNCHKVSYVDLINQNYEIQLKPLNTVDYTTMCVAINYFLLKKGECWIELNDEFQAEGAFLLTFDQQLIAAHMEAYYGMAVVLRTKQLKQTLNVEVKEVAKERLLYKMLGETSKSDIMDYLTELKMISCCTERTFRLAEKEKQRTQIFNSLRMDYGKNVSFHNTFAYNGDVCTVFNQHVDVISNVKFVDVSQQLLVPTTKIDPNDSDQNSH